MKKRMTFLTTGLSVVLLTAVLTPTLWGQRSAAAKNTETEPAVPSFQDDAEFLSLLEKSRTEAVDGYQEISDNEREKKARDELTREVKDLLYQLNRHPSRQNAASWVKFLKLQELQRALLSSEVSMDILEGSLKRFEHDDESLDEPFFAKVGESLANYIDVLKYPQESNERKQFFTDVCGQVTENVKALLNADNIDAAESVTAGLKTLSEYQPDSEPVKTITALIGKRFSTPNIQMEVNEKCLLSDRPSAFSEPVTVRENIRGTATNGSGTATGTLAVGFAANDKKAEIRLTLDTQIATKTVGYNQGVTVYTTSQGNVTANKSIYLNDDLTSAPAKATGQMNPRITNINSGRGNMGTQVVYDRVYQEFPYSKAESQRRMELRLASRLDEEVDKGLKNENGFTNLMKFLKDNDYTPRLIASRTTDDRLYWSALFGNEKQLGPTKEADFTASDYDLAVKIHQGAFNNAAYFALPGERISDRDFVERLDKLFPGVRTEAKAPEASANTEPKADKPSDAAEPADEKIKKDEPFFVTFADELPLTAEFADGQIRITVRVDLFEQEEKSFPGLDIEVIYAAEKRDGHFVLIQKSYDAWPAGQDRSAAVPARYQAIRTQILKRIAEGLPAERVLEPISVPDLLARRGASAKTNAAAPLGTLEVRELKIEGGWIVLGAQFAPSSK